jgi:hypothetical protein
LDSKEYASAYAIAKICGYTGSFDDFKNLYYQYYSEIVNSLPDPVLDKVEAIQNPFRMQR